MILESSNGCDGVINFPIGKNIRQLMACAKMSEADLCRGVNLPQTTVNRLLSGHTTDPRINTLVAIAQFFEVSLEQLLGFESIVPNNLGVSTRGCILPIVNWDSLQNWLYRALEITNELRCWIKTERNFNDHSFALPTPASCQHIFGENGLLLMNRLAPSEFKDGHIVLLEENNEFYLTKILKEGTHWYSKRLFAPYEITLLSDKAIFHACVMEVRNEILPK